MKIANKSLMTALPVIAAVMLLLTWGGLSCSHNGDKASATQPQATFASPDEAARAFVDAVRAHDKDRLTQILGPESQEVLSSGDPVADQQAQDRFIQAYDEKHYTTTDSDGSVTINVGNNNWPLPIPIVQDPKDKTWSFDTDAGEDEIINRRIGRNELNVIQVCQAICDAQEEYAREDPDHDGVPEYAQKFISDSGKKNGLYWETAPGEPPSPLGPLVAEAAAHGYTKANEPTSEPRPYQGYFYHIMTAQGKHAPGGARDYFIHGKLLGGFAVVAWPADYGNSGIMTFIVNYSGDVYQCDLGENTDKLARAMTTYDPGPNWKKAE